MEQQEIINSFNRIYYDGPDKKNLFTTTSWMGVPTYKCPMDTWVYQEILSRTRPDVIVETGVLYGGSALYLASICDLLGHGEVIACDISLKNVYEQARNHPRVTLLEGGSTDPGTLEKIRSACHCKKVMVILDSDHTEKHVLDELRSYGPLVSPGCYMICEDSNINGHPAYPEFGPGPYEAVQKFLAEESAWKVDLNCERLLVTFNPSGYLLRLE